LSCYNILSDVEQSEVFLALMSATIPRQLFLV